MKRRRFLAAAALGVAGANVSLITRIAGGAESPCPAPSLIQFLGDEEAVCRLGEAYRASHPLEDDARVLRKELERTIAQSGHAGLQPRPLQAAIANDFAGGRTVIVDGWVLARTEARQCALYSMA